MFSKMETLECIKTRRSRRLFLDKEVSEEQINKLLEAAIQAPSSQDCQPWHFILVKDKESKEKLAELKGEDNKDHVLFPHHMGDQFVAFHLRRPDIWLAKSRDLVS